METPYFNQAVEKAQTAGYDVKWDGSLVCFIGEDFSRCLTQKEIYSDILFWRSLRDAIGPSMPSTHPEIVLAMKSDWKRDWHRFIDHLSEEKDPEEFFKKILNEKRY